MQSVQADIDFCLKEYIKQKKLEEIVSKRRLKRPTTKKWQVKFSKNSMKKAKSIKPNIRENTAHHAKVFGQMTNLSTVCAQTAVAQWKK